MEDIYNLTSAQEWHYAMDLLQEHIRNAQDMPDWAIAVVVLCANMLCVLITSCAIGSAIYGIYIHTRKRRVVNALLNEVQMPEHSEEEADAENEKPVNTKKRSKSAQRIEEDI